MKANAGPGGGRARQFEPEARLSKRDALSLDREVEQRLGAARVTQLGQRLLLELPDPLAVRPSARPISSSVVRVAVVQAEPHGMIVASRGVSASSAERSLLGHQLAVHQLRGSGASTSSMRSPMLVSPSSPMVESSEIG